VHNYPTKEYGSHTMNVTMKTKDREDTLSEPHIMHMSPRVRLRQHHASYGVHSLFLLYLAAGKSRLLSTHLVIGSFTVHFSRPFFIEFVWNECLINALSWLTLEIRSMSVLYV
jgi:hypothetical protein